MSGEAVRVRLRGRTVYVTDDDPLPVVVIGGGGGGGGGGGLTNAELRAAPVPVSGTVAATCSGTVAVSGSVAVTGPVTDAQLRASALAVSVSTLPLPSGAATEAGLATLDGDLDAIYARLGNGSQHVAVDSLPAGLATSAKQDTCNASLASIDGKLANPLPVTGPATDAQMRASALPVSGPLTDAQMRAAAVPVSGAFFQATQPVSGTFFQATQPVSAVSLPLPSGAAADRTTAAAPSATRLSDGAAFYKATTPADTQPISAAALPLPSGAATDRATAAAPFSFRLSDGAAFYDARSIRGLTSADQVTIANASIPVTDNGGLLSVDDGGGSITVDGTVNATCSGTVTANIGTTNGLALDATLTGGTQKAITRGGAKGATSAADLTSTAEGADHQAIDVQLYHGGVAKDPTAVRALTSADIVTAAQGTAAAVAGAWPVKVTDGTNTLPTADVAARKLFAALTDGTSTAAVKAASTAAAAADPAAVVSLSPNSPVTPPTLTKGAQGATGFSVQSLKDAGRVLKTYTVSALATVTSEALISLTPYADLVAGSAGTTFAVTAGKRLRIQQIIVTVRCTGTVNVGGIVRLRLLAGSVLVASPVHASVGCMGSNLATAVIGNAQTFAIDFPDGLELSGLMQFGLTQLFSATGATIDVAVIGYEY